MRQSGADLRKRDAAAVQPARQPAGAAVVRQQREGLPFPRHARRAAVVAREAASPRHGVGAALRNARAERRGVGVGVGGVRRVVVVSDEARRDRFSCANKR